MPMTTSGPPKEPKNEQQAVGHSQSSLGEIVRGLAVMGYSNKRGAQFLFDCDDVPLPALNWTLRPRRQFRLGEN